MHLSTTPSQITHAKPRLAIIAVCAMLLPILVFYGLLARYAINIPYLDDYDGVLGFLEHYSRPPTAAAKLGSILYTQHNEYKTIFANAVITLQYELSGHHPNFVILSWAGNIFILALFYLLWRNFLPREDHLRQRLVLFVPVAYILFQLQYVETLNWSMPGLQNIPVLIFALASITYLVRESTWGFVLACVFLVLTIAASGNGFVLLPIGVAMLLPRKLPIRIAGWVVVSILCIVLYFHHYNVHSSQQEQNGSVLLAARHLNPIFTLSFMGAALGSHGHLVRYLSILLGILIGIVLVLMVKRRYDKVNPVVFYYAAFLLLTAIAVSCIRSKLGLEASIAGRYKMYSDLLLICCYMFFVEVYAGTLALRRRYFQVALVASILFCIRYDISGTKYLIIHKRDLVEGAQLYQVSHHQQGPTEIYGDANKPLELQIDRWARGILEDAESTGMYRYP